MSGWRNMEDLPKRGQLQRRKVPVEIRPVVAPDGRPGVLLQLPDGFTIVNPEDAPRLAAMLLDAAELAERGEWG